MTDSDIYKLIHPVKYFNDFVSQNIRPDGRNFEDQRNLKISVGSLKSPEASTVLKCGNTTIVCGIKLELAVPKAEQPDVGYVVTNVELPPLCSSKYKPGPPSDQAQVVSHIVSDILTNSKCIDFKDLCIVPDKLAWVLYCDMICLDNDGSLVDACIMTLMASLKTLNLPKVIYDPDTDNIEVDENIKTPLKIHGLPVATSFAIQNVDQRSILLTDPTVYEEDMCGGAAANYIVCYNNHLLCDTQKFGGCNLSTETQEKALKIAKKRAKLVEEFINAGINNKDK